MQTA
jgi:hypothetical protein